MKTLTDILILINEQMEHCKRLDPRKDKRALSTGKKKLEFLNAVRLYMETAPSMDYCTIMISNLENDIRVLHSRMPLYMEDNPEAKKLIKSYENTSGITRKMQQIKFIKFILK